MERGNITSSFSGGKEPMMAHCLGVERCHS